MDAPEYAALLEAGFRRFGRLIFHPACEACRLCIPIRVPLDRFRPSKSQRRVLRRNRDTVLEVGEPAVDAERLEVYHAFHRERADTVGWAAQSISVEEYTRTWLDNAVPTLELRYRVAGRLIAIAYVDESPAGLNSIYCYYHPDFRDRSPGTFDVLREIELAREKRLPFVYLGYYVPGCRSMEYKANFRPVEVRLDGAWRELEKDTDLSAISPPPRS